MLVSALNSDPLAGDLIAAQVVGGVNVNPGATVIGLSTLLDFKMNLIAAADPSNLNSVLSLYSEATAQATAAANFNTSGGSLASVAFTAKAPAPRATALRSRSPRRIWARTRAHPLR